MNIRQEHPWAKRPTWQKRLHGFVCYQMTAIVALLFPVEADKAMYTTLREQFAGDSDDYEAGYQHGLRDGRSERHNAEVWGAPPTGGASHTTAGLCNGGERKP